jgi:PAS domain S-box-containing protein
MESNTKQPTSAVLKALEVILPVVPTPLYWMSTEGRVLAINDRCLETIGATRDIIGKTSYEFYPFETADHILKHNQKVIETGQILSQEERIEDITTGQIKYLTSIKAPLLDDEGNTIGILGTSIEITAEKEAERLRLENERNLSSLQAQEKFTDLAEQVAHDIRSPVSALLMVLKACHSIPEKERVTLREAATRIQDIANHLLKKSKLEAKSHKLTVAQSTEEAPVREAILLSALLLELVTEKRFQYQDLPIQFETDFTQAGYFAFIQSEISTFKRMISNLINNAVDAFEEKPGKVRIKLDAVAGEIKVVIEDNGKGIPPHVLEKILQNLPVTEGKEDGNGIGLTQVRKTLADNEGKLLIESRIEEGTQITLSFPQTDAPQWFAEQIILRPDSLIVILDDDSSIHTAWDTRFDVIRQAEPGIQIQHFEHAWETLDFLKKLSPEQKDKVVLLTDYELLHQNASGIDVIKKSGLPKCILVTSHYAKPELHTEVIHIGTRILPKEMASEVPIKIIKSAAPKSSELKKVDLIIVEDDRMLSSALASYFEGTHSVVVYEKPEELLKNLSAYEKHTKISLDHSFDNSPLKGLEVAKKLYEEGYTNLLLLSGTEFEPSQLPSYLTFVLKTDPDMLEKLTPASLSV